MVTFKSGGMFEDASEDENVVEMFSKERLYGGGRREARNMHSLQTKIDAIGKMQAGKIASIVSSEMGIPVGVISQWWLQRDDIRAQYDQQEADAKGEDALEEHIKYVQDKFEKEREEKAKEAKELAELNPVKKKKKRTKVTGSKMIALLSQVKQALGTNSDSDIETMVTDEEAVKLPDTPDKEVEEEDLSDYSVDGENLGVRKKKRARSKAAAATPKKKLKVDNTVEEIVDNKPKPSKKKVKTTTYEVKESDVFEVQLAKQVKTSTFVVNTDMDGAPIFDDTDPKSQKAETSFCQSDSVPSLLTESVPSLLTESVSHLLTESAEAISHKLQADEILLSQAARLLIPEDIPSNILGAASSVNKMLSPSSQSKITSITISQSTSPKTLLDIPQKQTTSSRSSTSPSKKDDKLQKVKEEPTTPFKQNFDTSKHSNVATVTPLVVKKELLNTSGEYIETEVVNHSSEQGSVVESPFKILEKVGKDSSTQAQLSDDNSSIVSRYYSKVGTVIKPSPVKNTTSVKKEPETPKKTIETQTMETQTYEAETVEPPVLKRVIITKEITKPQPRAPSPPEIEIVEIKQEPGIASTPQSTPKTNSKRAPPRQIVQPYTQSPLIQPLQPKKLGRGKNQSTIISKVPATTINKVVAANSKVPGTIINSLSVSQHNKTSPLTHTTVISRRGGLRGRAGVRNIGGRGVALQQQVITRPIQQAARGRAATTIIRGRQITPALARGRQVVGRGGVVQQNIVRGRGRAGQVPVIRASLPATQRLTAPIQQATLRGGRTRVAATRVLNHHPVRQAIQSPRARGVTPVRNTPPVVRPQYISPQGRGIVIQTRPAQLQPVQAVGRGQQRGARRGGTVISVGRAAVPAKPMIRPAIRPGVSPMRGAILQANTRGGVVRTQYQVNPAPVRGTFRGSPQVRGVHQRSPAPVVDLTGGRGAVRGGRGVRAPYRPQSLMQFSNTKKKVSLELSDRQLQALKNLGLM